MQNDVDKQQQSKSLWRHLHPLKVGPPEQNALLALRAPLSETSFPQPGGDEAYFSLDCLQQVVNTPVVAPPEPVFEVQEEEEIARRQIRTVWGMREGTPAEPLEFCADQKCGMRGCIVHMKAQRSSARPQEASSCPDGIPSTLDHCLEDELVHSSIAQILDVDKALLVKEWDHEDFLH